MIPIWAIKLAVVAAVGVAGFAGGVRVTSDHWKAKLLTAQQEHEEDLREANERNNALSARLELDREGIRVVYRTIERRVEKIVDRPVYRAECIDDDGLQLVNDALRGQASDPGKPDKPVSGTKPAGG